MGSASSVVKGLADEGSALAKQMIVGGPPARLPVGTIVMIDQSAAMARNPFDDEEVVDYGEGALAFGWISGCTTGVERNDYEYTIAIEENVTYCVQEQYLSPLKSAVLPWLSSQSREVAVQVETHGTKKFIALLLHRRDNMKYQIKFLADNKHLDDIPADHLSEPDEETCRDSSPYLEPPDPLWLLDRKIQANIDEKWPMEQRIAQALATLRVIRSASTPPLCGSFVGKGMKDSEGYPAHPAPLRNLIVNGVFVDTWSKYAGRIKFAATYKIGPKHPGFSDWVESVDAGDPLYFHAALPVYAGLICIGNFGNQAEWVRASDVALVGIALYVNDELQPGFANPPLEKDGLDKYGHECCHFIPGCASTYLADMAWVGAVFCLAPTDGDCELRDDVYNIEAYHQILKDWARINREGGFGREIVVTVNLVLSTNYLANLRQVCAGAVRVTLSDKGIMTARVRMRDILENRLNSRAAKNPRRPRKVLSEVTYGMHLQPGGFGATVFSGQTSVAQSHLDPLTPQHGGTPGPGSTEATLPLAAAATTMTSMGSVSDATPEERVSATPPTAGATMSSFGSVNDPTPMAKSSRPGAGRSATATSFGSANDPTPISTSAAPKAFPPGKPLQPLNPLNITVPKASGKGPPPPPPPAHAERSLFGPPKK